MSLKKQALSGVFWSSLQLFGTQGVSFVISVILARLLMPSEFGLIAMLSIFMGLGTVLINGGLTQSLIRTQDPDEEDFATVFYFNLVGSILIYIIVFVCAPLIANFYKQELLVLIVRVYAIIFIINAFGAIQLTRLNKMMDFKTQLKISIPSIVLSGLTGISLAYIGFGVWSLVWSSIVQALAGTIQLWYWANWKPLWVFSKEKFNHHFQFGIKLMFSGVLDVIFTNAYTIVIGKFFIPAQVGFYNRADTLQMLPVGTLSSVVTKVTYPLFSSIQNDDVRLKSVYKRIMQMVIFLVAPTLILMAVLAEPLFRFLFTERWLPAVPYFQILCVNGILYPIHSYNLQILTVKGRSDLFLRLEVIKKIIVVMVLLVSFQYGIYGLLYGSVLTSVLAFFINTHYSGKFLNYTGWEQTKDILPIIFVSVLVGGLVLVSDLVLKNYYFIDFFRLALGSFLGIVLYITSAYLFKLSSLFELITIVKRQ
ncbi:Membrane protein involved in the export of O-antigen and teichoic acid [Flavobacterium fryxellicola]|uniref:Lipopolysaccharide biosynthesis protein n=1 Tax=Flavobacterium fryxellicola TaxID=249352 RepID=A0A167V1Q1_9FLAO|nr:lipopolysaccharide biosynthesis protein [Flavobacterium fryxellicola]OAB25999.1 lipopolysaccharide biosynthesis protein [Flavobacterium fryxellicola]SHN69490.1 Membrane protein involved in the export of O-antigen and teichoic acid [Flavobacterium fryxellicola]